METVNTFETGEIKTLVQDFHQTLARIREQVGKIIVGSDDVLDHLLLTLLVGGHCLITGMPGTAKTLLVRSLAGALGLTFKRIQFTPDLMPTDVTGTDVIEEDVTTGHRTWTFVPGPIFTNVLLADEINRTPPKTQSALLEAMQEFTVTVRGNRYDLAPPFFVLATRNPIELEGTYSLPEAQLDRFLFDVVLEYLDPEEEMEVVTRHTTRVPLPEVERRLRAAGSLGPDAAGGGALYRARADPEVPVAGAPGAVVGVGEPLCRGFHPRYPAARPRGPRGGASLRELRRQRPGHGFPDSGRQGPRTHGGTLSRDPRGSVRAGAAGAEAPRADELSRRVGWRERG